MEKIIFQTENLTKKFGTFTALDNIGLSLQKGHIYGCIGENGAGKTTLMKIMTGLTFPTSGAVSLFGESTRQGIERMRRYTGSTIEAPALYPDYTAYQNLELQRILVGNPDKRVCDGLLRMAELSESRDKKVRAFSMGMKQRLGIAMALAGNPELLILDEPVNGLDPKNISILRKELKMLNEERETTLFISSHILNELYLLATDYIILHRGKIVEKLTHEELESRCGKYIRIKMEPAACGVTVLERFLGTGDFKVLRDDAVCLYSHTDEVERVARVLHENNILVTELSVCGQTLEEYFLSVTGGACDDESDET